MLDRTSPIPLYHQISEAILQSIHNGQFKPSDPIPTEQELIKIYGVSRITVRRAIQELENRGYLILRQGVGTFVAPVGVRRGATQLSSFTEETISRGMKPGSELLALRKEPASEIVANKLEIPRGQKIYYVERLRKADGLIIALNKSYLNLPTGIVLTAARLEETGSLWAFLERSGVFIVDVDRTIVAGSAEEYVAKILDIKVNEPVLSVDSVVYSGNSTPIEVSQIIGRSDRYKFNFRYRR